MTFNSCTFCVREAPCPGAVSSTTHSAAPMKSPCVVLLFLQSACLLFYYVLIFLRSSGAFLLAPPNCFVLKMCRKWRALHWSLSVTSSAKVSFFRWKFAPNSTCMVAACLNHLAGLRSADSIEAASILPEFV